MGCLITQSLSVNCEFFLGGLDKLALCNKSQFSSCTSTVITMSGAATFFEYEFVENTGAFTNELTVNGGNRYITQGIAFQLGNKSTATLAEAPNLALGRFVAACKDRFGSTYIIGRTGRGLRAVTASLNSGAADGDFAGLSVTMSNPCVEYALLYTGTIPGIANW